jgi:hypothetical protein
LIEIKLDQEMSLDATIGTMCQTSLAGLVARHSCDQKLRRFVLRPTGRCRLGREWKSAQISTPAKTTNIDSTATETRIESAGIATSFCLGGSMPNRPTWF